MEFKLLITRYPAAMMHVTVILVRHYKIIRYRYAGIVYSAGLLHCARRFTVQRASINKSRCD